MMMPSTRHHTVHGMTCSHCVMSVREEVSEIAEVTSVGVSLASGRLTDESSGHHAHHAREVMA
jgi:copper chaperone CopZ